jgi:hypothetical protein
VRHRAICAALLLATTWALSACAGDTTSKPSIESGEYSGVSVAGQSVVIDVVGDKIRVNAADASLDDPTTNAQFTVDVGGSSEDFSCSNGNTGHTLSCAVKRSKQLTVRVPCSLLNSAPSSASASPSPSASAAATPTASAFPSPAAGSGAAVPIPSLVPSLCPATLPNSETIDLLHLCSNAPCSDQPT